MFYKKKDYHLMEGLAKSGYRNQITVQNFNHPSMFFWLYTENLVIFTNFSPQLLAIENLSPQVTHLIFNFRFF
jgi:hypothetical protein